ncbi:MAG TPA: hypothetical protein VHS09_05000 [Polyangiaceae bacterium]|jgi:hypothetical protein|nr:hypothetical protein [Polyangiaceae bacterium]
MLDSQRWKCVEAVPPLLFSVEGPSALRGREPGRRGWLTIAQGRVEHVGVHHVELGGDVTLAYVVPSRVDLRPLEGALVKVTLADEPATAGPRAQTLSISDEAGLPLLLARFGPAGQTHAIGKSRVRTTLSQRPGGPMAFGTEKLQYMMQVGDHVRVREPVGEFVVHFVARTAFDHVAYVIAHEAMWLSGRR